MSERETILHLVALYIDANRRGTSVDLGLSWTKTYPRESFAFNSLGIASAAFGQHEQAVAACRSYG